MEAPFLEEGWEVVDVYFYYDGLRLFACKHHKKTGEQLYLAQLSDSDKDFDEWVLVPISAKTKQELETSRISVREAMLYSPTAIIIKNCYAAESKQINKNVLLGEEDAKDYLPTIDTYFSLNLNQEDDSTKFLGSR